MISNNKFEQMSTDKFEAKYIKPYIKYFDSFITSRKEKTSDIYSSIYDKSVLILDDTISHGDTVSYCVEALNTTSKPNKCYVITLLSPLII